MNSVFRHSLLCFRVAPDLGFRYCLGSTTWASSDCLLKGELAKYLEREREEEEEEKRKRKKKKGRA